jgi:nicotinate phosphoribosyltransferase
VDTYDALKSGLSNFLAVSLALHSAGYAPVGIALDSGDLAYQSKEARRVFRKVADTFEIPSFRYVRTHACTDVERTYCLLV